MIKVELGHKTGKTVTTVQRAFIASRAVVSIKRAYYCVFFNKYFLLIFLELVHARSRWLDTKFVSVGRAVISDSGLKNISVFL